MRRSGRLFVGLRYGYDFFSERTDWLVDETERHRKEWPQFGFSSYLELKSGVVFQIMRLVPSVPLKDEQT